MCPSRILINRICFHCLNDFDCCNKLVKFPLKPSRLLLIESSSVFVTRSIMVRMVRAQCIALVLETALDLPGDIWERLTNDFGLFHTAVLIVLLLDPLVVIFKSQYVYGSLYLYGLFLNDNLLIEHLSNLART